MGNAEKPKSFTERLKETTYALNESDKNNAKEPLQDLLHLSRDIRVGIVDAALLAREELQEQLASASKALERFPNHPDAKKARENITSLTTTYLQQLKEQAPTTQQEPTEGIGGAVTKGLKSFVGGFDAYIAKPVASFAHSMKETLFSTASSSALYLQQGFLMAAGMFGLDKWVPESWKEAVARSAAHKKATEDVELVLRVENEERAEEGKPAITAKLDNRDAFIVHIINKAGGKSADLPNVGALASAALAKANDDIAVLDWEVIGSDIVPSAKNKEEKAEGKTEEETTKEGAEVKKAYPTLGNTPLNIAQFETGVQVPDIGIVKIQRSPGEIWVGKPGQEKKWKIKNAFDYPYSINQLKWDGGQLQFQIFTHKDSMNKEETMKFLQKLATASQPISLKYFTHLEL